MDGKTLQEVLRDAGHYRGRIDGIVGPKTKAAVDAFLAEGASSDWKRWGLNRRKVMVAQIAYTAAGIETGPIDGYAGAQTQFAHESWLHWKRTGKLPEPWRDDVQDDKAPKPVKNSWPRQRSVQAFYGKPGSNQVSLLLPYPMKIAWNRRQTITKFSCHAKVHDSLERIYTAVKDHYGMDEIKRLHLDMFGGCLNVRRMRGGSAWSMHSWGIAVDTDPIRNQFKWGRDQASLDGIEYEAWWRIWEAEGWLSLGRARNFDWMHVQAARL